MPDYIEKIWGIIYTRIIERRSYSIWAISGMMVCFTVALYAANIELQKGLYIVFGAPVIYAVIVYGLGWGVIITLASIVLSTIPLLSQLIADINKGNLLHIVFERAFIPLFYFNMCLIIGRLITSERESQFSYREMAERYAALAEDLRVAHENLNHLFNSTIQTLAAAIEAKDPYTRGHSERVTKYAVSLARALCLPENEIMNIFYASILHDIGKIGIDEKILQKPTKLTYDEYNEIKKHAEIGAGIISGIRDIESIIPYILHHHERYDGHGYPLSSRGEDIPLGARIITIADSFDAMTTDRPYRQAMSWVEAKKELIACAGTQFDRLLVHKFIEVLDKQEFRFPEYPKTAQSSI